MKKLSLLLAFAMVFALAACNNSRTEDNPTSSVEEQQAGSSEQLQSENSEIAPSENVAVGKQVFFSSHNDTMGMLSSNAVDGNEETAWSSDSAKKNIDEWIIVDLGENYNIDAINVK